MPIASEMHPHKVHLERQVKRTAAMTYARTWLWRTEQYAEMETARERRQNTGDTDS